jgi:O-antigen/teichoic acid export membrane protein
MRNTSTSRPVSGRQIARGAAWLTLFKVIDKGIGVLSTLVLARLLVPADFGLVAMAMAVVAFTQLMSAFGFDSALIQRQNAQRDHFDTAWTFNVLFGVGISVALAILAWPMAQLYRDDRLVAVLLVLGLGALVGGFENIGTVAFRKELDFRSEFRFLLFKRIASFVVTIGLAFAFRSYWALVGGTVTGRLMAVWISYRLHPFRPRLTLRARADLLHFSKWILISSVLQFLQVRSTDFILGRTVGPHGLGVYSVALEIANMPSTELIAPVNRAVYPAYASLAVDIGSLRERFFEVFAAICMVGFPVSGVLLAVADPAVRVVLGDKWLESIALIQVFGLQGLLGALQSNLYLVVVALGKPKANTVLTAVLVAVSLPLVVWASLTHGVRGAAVAQLVTGMLGFAGILYVFRKLAGVKLATLARIARRPLLSTLLLVASLRLIDVHAVADWPALPKLIVLLAAAVLLAPAYAVAVWRLSGRPAGPEETLLRLLGSKATTWMSARGA